MTLPHLRSLVVLLALVLATPAWADETVRGTPPVLKPDALDLIPFDDLQRTAFNKQHGGLAYRTREMAKKVRQAESKLNQRRAARAKAKDKKAIDAEIRKLEAQRKRVRGQLSGLLARLTDELVAHGMNPVLIPVMNNAAKGRGRLERYSHSLVLLIPDLDPDQWDLFHGVLERTEGAYQALGAQRERTQLALKQADLSRDQARAIQSSFDQQMRLIDKRFWQLVDYVLDEDQRAAYWQNLPNGLKRKSQAKEHLFLLAGLTPSQLSRLQALTTELEHESSPDTAAVQRARKLLQDKSLDAMTRKELNQERNDAYKRLAEIREFGAREIKKVLTGEQYHEYQSIPPRLSTNDRRYSYKQVLEGFPATPAQRKRVQALSREAQVQRRAVNQKVAELRRESGNFGPDSPQMAGMRMMMAGAQSEGARAQRAFLGRLFLEVLTPDDVSNWVLGHWGYKR